MRYRRLTAAICFLFGLAVIANTQAGSDGSWFWYAILLHGGKRLYADLHLVQQPLFILETAGSMALFGKSWLASKVIAVLHLFSLCLGMYLLIRRSNLSDSKNALVLAGAFFVSIHFEAFRFDDYHVPVDSLCLYSILILLPLIDQPGSARRDLGLAAALGVLSGLALTFRVNDGAALFVAAIAILAISLPERRIALVAGCIAACSAGAALAALAVILLTGDSLRDYAMNSIFLAAGNKGGTGSLLRYPFLLPWNALNFAAAQWVNLLWLGAAAASFVFLVLPSPKKYWRSSAFKMAIGCSVIVVTIVVFWPVLFYKDLIIVLMSAIWVAVAYVLGLMAVLRLFPNSPPMKWWTKWGMKWRKWRLERGQAKDISRRKVKQQQAAALEPLSARNPREMLVMIPLALLASASLSSGGFHFGLYSPIAMLILILPVVYRIPEGWTKSLLLTVCGMMAITGAIYRFDNPFSWHSYHSPVMFTHRQVFRHPEYGPMIIDDELFALIDPFCRDVQAGGADGELLSLPLPFANYFCAIPPWHDYVQTFFDTSDRPGIVRLIEELKTAPPKWILYQRQLDNLARHEQTFNNGQRLPHRDLDELIFQKVLRDEWQLVDHRLYGIGSNFLLIRTRK